jgi:conjugal transfer pilus assembly protein TrbC
MQIKSLLSMVVLIILCINLSESNAYEVINKQPSSILVFVSFSMHDLSLKQWMRQAALIHAPVVVRGLIHNSFKETMQKMTALTRDNQGGVQIDPVLFRRFHIDRVPAVVVWRETNCLPSQSCKESYDVVYGNVTLAFALQKIVDEQDDLSSVAAKAIAVLQDAQHA